ncbi:DUF397 domain-containing protein [Actinomadura rubrisoli]|uniref:DUF397 domain-containing protein n=1 Tax=Actinomadura rubrisoli TaxID=2530368 RepID=A0A4V2YVB0_9ACTN|nr:DUF397 domain-containing protein [Actinomadura rubrisoli]TDD80787.1 DUF397 domain-containing protein [Actinomadura rubrisoli]
MNFTVPVWRKASRSHDDGDACIEVAAILDVVVVRDSKDPEGPRLVLEREDFQRVIKVIKRA